MLVEIIDVEKNLPEVNSHNKVGFPFSTWTADLFVLQTDLTFNI